MKRTINLRNYLEKVLMTEEETMIMRKEAKRMIYKKAPWKWKKNPRSMFPSRRMTFC